MDESATGTTHTASGLWCGRTHEFRDDFMSMPGDVKYTVTAINDDPDKFLHSEPSSEITLMDNPVVRVDGNSKDVVNGNVPALRGQATLRWPKVSGATAYTIRYRQLPGDHSRLNWRPQSPYPYRPEEGPPWREIRLLPRDIETDREDRSRYKHPITGLALNKIYAVHVNYSKGSSEFFSVREAYVWPADRAGGAGGYAGERVATFPLNYPLPNKTYSYVFCEETFPIGKKEDWKKFIRHAFSQWDLATNGWVTTELLEMDADGNTLMCADYSRFVTEIRRRSG